MARDPFVRGEGRVGGQILHGSAAKIEPVRQAIQHRQASLKGALEVPRDQPEDRRQGRAADHGRRSAHGLKVSGFDDLVSGRRCRRRHTLLPLDDGLYVPQIYHPAPDVLVAAPFGIDRGPQ